MFFAIGFLIIPYVTSPIGPLYVRASVVDTLYYQIPNYNNADHHI